MAKRVLVEQTPKHWKIVQLLGVIGSIACVFLFFFGQSDLLSGFGILGVLLFILLFLIGRIGAWWSAG